VNRRTHDERQLDTPNHLLTSESHRRTFPNTRVWLLPHQSGKEETEERKGKAVVSTTNTIGTGNKPIAERETATPPHQNHLGYETGVAAGTHHHQSTPVGEELGLQLEHHQFTPKVADGPKKK
jgi:hypothetical protein